MPRPLRIMTAAQASGQVPLEERVEQRAYELYVLRGNESGSETGDWEQAEDELRDAAEQLAKRG